jgi:hypothetical protein
MADPSSAVQLLGPRSTCTSERARRPAPAGNQLVVVGAAALRPHQQVVNGC